MKVQIRGEGEVNLTDRDFVAEGGEGKVYAKAGVGYKVYHDPAKAIPLGKIKELSSIQDNGVIKPDKPLYGGRGAAQHVGHTFRYVKDTVVLCQLFTRAFREREGFTHEMSLTLMRRLQEGVSNVHRAGVLIVDLNEMNFLVSHDLTTPFFIDVDSYQTEHYPATAIMPSVRDWKTKLGDFTEMSDWFSFAIVSFQLLVGIHPFKGKHPTVKGLEDRMKQDLSIFDPKVKTPATTYPLDVIPPAYRDWYRALFVDGKRLPPPTDLHGAVVVRQSIRTIKGSGNLEIHEIAAFTGDIRVLAFLEAKSVAQVGDALYLDQRRVRNCSAPVFFGCTPKNGRIIAAITEQGSLGLWDLTDGTALPVMLNCDEMMSYDGRIYVRTGEKVFEVTFTEAANKTWVGTSLAANILPNASRLYDGVLFQNLLGEPHITVFPRSGASYQVKLPEIREHRVVTAKFDHGVLMILAASNGKYRRMIFRFDEDYKYDVRIVEDVIPTGLNFVTLDSGVCVCMDEEERLEVFAARKGSASMKQVDDDALGADMRLVKDGGRVLFYRGDKLYSMRMK